jgi:ribosomal protein S20
MAETDEDNQMKVLSALDEVVRKLKIWAPQALSEIGGNTEDCQAMRKAMDHDALLYVGEIRTFLKDYKKQVENKDWEYFQTLLPEKYQKVEIPKTIVEKGLLYLQVFQSLLKDLDNS